MGSCMGGLADFILWNAFNEALPLLVMQPREHWALAVPGLCVHRVGTRCGFVEGRPNPLAPVGSYLRLMDVGYGVPCLRRRKLRRIGCRWASLAACAASGLAHTRGCTSHLINCCTLCVAASS